MQNPVLNKALRFGGIVGGVSIILTLVLYIADYSLLVDWKVGLSLLAIFIGLVIYGGIAYRKEVGGYLTFGDAYIHGYVVLMVSSLIGSLFSILLYNVIDPELPQKMADVAIENSRAMMEKFGAPEGKIDEAIAQQKIDMPARFSTLGVIKQFGWGFLINAVIALITGAIAKKKKPETDTL